MIAAARRVLALCAALLLSACSRPAAPAATPPPALRPAVQSTPRPAAPPTAAPAAEQAPTAAPAETLPGRLVFVQAGDLWSWQAGNVQRLTSDGALFAPTIAPDGKRIAAVRRGESASDLVLLGADGGALTRLTRNIAAAGDSFSRAAEGVWALAPVWSSDGTALLYISQYGPPFGGPPAAEYRLSLFTLPVARPQAREQLLAIDAGNLTQVAVGPASQLVVSYTPSEQGDTELLRYSRDGSAAPIAGVPSGAYDPAISPDGRWLAFARRDGSATDLYALPLAGGTPVRLTSNGTARAPVWSPDGKQIAFLAPGPQTRRFELWVLDVSGAAGLRAGPPRRLTDDAAIDADSRLAWGP